MKWKISYTLKYISVSIYSLISIRYQIYNRLKNKVFLRSNILLTRYKISNILELLS